MSFQMLIYAAAALAASGLITGRLHRRRPAPDADATRPRTSRADQERRRQLRELAELRQPF